MLRSTRLLALAATAEAEELVCADAPLARLDRELADLYAAAEKTLPADGASAEREAQRAWVARRSACGKGGDARVGGRAARLRAPDGAARAVR